MPEKDHSGTPLPKKLGIKEGGRVVLIGAPEGFTDLLVPWPAEAVIFPRARKPLDVAVLFATRRSDLARRFPPLVRALDRAGGLWVGWPKKTSGIVTDLTFEEVQGLGLAAGLVDNKSAALDADWQGVRFVFRLEDRPTR
ncbi:MAG: DUF3052 domain-containing protein [Actinomycetota bacterium]